MTTTLTLTPPCAYINSNDRLHHHARAKLTKAWRDLAHVTALTTEAHMYDRAHVTITFRFPTNHRRDVGNYYPTAKAALDGIVAAGRHLPDDSDAHIVGPDLRRMFPNGTPLVVVTIEAL